MPAWGVNGGGAMNDQQLSDLVAYLQTIQLTPAQAKAEAAQYGTDGRALFNAYCARCHTKGYSYGAPSIPGRRRLRAQHHRWIRDPSVRQPGRPGRLRHPGSEYGKPYGARGVGQMAAANRIDPETPGSAGAGRRHAILLQLTHNRAD